MRTDARSLRGALTEQDLREAFHAMFPRGPTFEAVAGLPERVKIWKISGDAALSPQPHVGIVPGSRLRKKRRLRSHRAVGSTRAWICMSSTPVPTTRVDRIHRPPSRCPLDVLADGVARWRGPWAPQQRRPEPSTATRALEHPNQPEAAADSELPAAPVLSTLCTSDTWHLDASYRFTGEGRGSMIELRLITQAKDQDDGRT